MKDKLTVTNANGETKTAEVLTFFSLNETGYKYLIYTLNEIDTNGLIKLYVSKATEQNGEYVLSKIETDSEWMQIKDVMRDMIVGGESASV